ncbi:hypothetical protein [Cryptosporangium aurantiacum]|uniref:Lipoprotein n=1 Tax=Cryptosporangium aurantiacum TaxID=134849 RepID=A0A1M7RNH3_9ACTN|nr:hypothetical protein [Cryptosporangium aurantiacum]SHN47761.1 hypothetical protein SAMN05443668_12764 [Cryptosporangium aurantiacum]
MPRRVAVALLALLTAACGPAEPPACAPCAGPSVSVDLTSVIRLLPAGTTAQLCITPPAKAEACKTPEPVSQGTVLLFGLDGSALTTLGVVLAVPGRPPTRFEVLHPTPYQDRCCCVDDCHTYRSYSYRLAGPDGPLVHRPQPRPS